jgi:hypothetical protein
VSHRANSSEESARIMWSAEREPATTGFDSGSVQPDHSRADTAGLIRKHSNEVQLESVSA